MFSLSEAQVEVLKACEGAGDYFPTTFLSALPCNNALDLHADTSANQFIRARRIMILLDVFFFLHQSENIAAAEFYPICKNLIASLAKEVPFAIKTLDSFAAEQRSFNVEKSRSLSLGYFSYLREAAKAKISQDEREKKSYFFLSVSSLWYVKLTHVLYLLDSGQFKYKQSIESRLAMLGRYLYGLNQRGQDLIIEMLSFLKDFSYEKHLFSQVHPSDTEFVFYIAFSHMEIDKNEFHQVYHTILRFETFLGFQDDSKKMAQHRYHVRYLIGLIWLNYAVQCGFSAIDSQYYDVLYKAKISFKAFVKHYKNRKNDYILKNDYRFDATKYLGLIADLEDKSVKLELKPESFWENRDDSIKDPRYWCLNFDAMSDKAYSQINWSPYLIQYEEINAKNPLSEKVASINHASSIWNAGKGQKKIAAAMREVEKFIVCL